ncbi:MAG: response regulator [Candidatus Zixiibacteriota bacterium]
MEDITKKILLVEDNPADVRLLKEALLDLSDDEIEVDVAGDGIIAIDYLENANVNPDFILLDLNLPRMDGREVLANIKANSRLKVIPVIVLTSSRADEDVVNAYQNNANCYIKKPVDFDNYLDIVSQIKNFWVDVAILPPKKSQNLNRN